MAPTRRCPVYLEIGSKRTFACAVDWSGWSRSGRGEDDALETLAAYAGRYARVATRAGLASPSPSAPDLDVVERVTGNATTDFGAPSAIAGVDRRKLDAAAARRIIDLLTAAWDEFETVAAGAPMALRKGPRGGGRDRDAVVEHVIDAERSYARKIGVALTAEEWRDSHARLLRERIGDVLSRARAGGLAREDGWPARYVARRMAWHALDHAWEIEDRST